MGREIIALNNAGYCNEERVSDPIIIFDGLILAKNEYL